MILCMSRVVHWLSLIHIFQEEKNLKPEKETIKCPLTVREGGDWLSHMFEEKTPAVTRIEEKITTDPDEVKDPAVLVKEVWFRCV